MEQKLKKIKPMVRLSQSQIDSKKEFIRQYIEAENASSGSTVDSNANVSIKTVATLGAELNKDICIQINRSTMCDYIEKYFDRETAEDYVKLLEEHTIYKHDETSPAPYYPYTYSPDEVVFVVYKDEPYIISFKNLYDLCSEEEYLLDEEKGVWGKYPEDMKIADKEGFTKVERLIKKNRHRDMVYVRTDCGEDLLVTDNHPLIVNDNIEDTVEAKDSLSKKQYSCSINYDTKQKEYIDSSSFLETYDDVFTNHYSIKVNNLWTFFPKSVKFSSDLGYFIGFFIGDGHYIRDKYLIITQKDKSVLTHLGDILYRELGIPSSIVKKDTGNCYNLRICSKPLVTMFREYFKIGKYSVNKTIPYNILSFSDEFIDGIISGLIDSDGTLNTNNTALIRVCSRSLIEQLAVLFRIKKVAFHVRRQKVTKSKTGYSSKYDIYCINFDCKKFTKYEKTPYTHNSRYNENWNILDTGTDTWKDIVSVDYDLSKKYLEEMDYIYDITTSTHTFICNGLLVHNCVAINMYPFLEYGMTKLGGESTAPKHLESYCGSLINLIFAISSQFAGACNGYNQPIMYEHNGVTYSKKFGDFVNSFSLNNIFSNYQGIWEYADISNLGYKVSEDGKFVNINKVYRRKYGKKLYRIKTSSGYCCEVSEDHIFKVLFRGRELEVKAKDLLVNDTVFMNKDMSPYIHKDSEEFKKGFLVGIICGDGNLTDEPNVRLSVNNNQDYVIQTVNNYLQSINLPVLNINDGNKCLDCRKYSNELYNFFKQYIIGVDCYSKHIDVEKYSLDFLVGFLDGLFTADGSYSENRGISITLTNKELINNVKDIVKKLYIKTNSIKVIPENKNKKESYNLYISSRIIKYLNITPYKIIHRDKLTNIDNSREVYYYGNTAFKQIHSNAKHKVKPISDGNQDVEYKTDVISEIEIIDNYNDYVYEIETETHWYNDGGFITHNCATAEALLYFHYFAQKDYGKDYLKTHTEMIKAKLQHVV